MLKSNNLKIKHKLIGIIFFSSFVAIITNYLFVINNEYNFFKKDLIRETKIHADFISDYSLSLLKNKKYDKINELISNLKNIPDIAKCLIYNDSGKVVSQYISPDFKNDIFDYNSSIIKNDSIYFSNTYLFLTKSIKGDKKYGSVFIISKSDIIWSRLNEYLTNGAILLIALLSLSYLLAKWLQRYISHPINELVNYTQEISHTEDYSKRAPKHLNDEIGLLYDSYNIMMEKLELREKERNIALEELKESEEGYRLLHDTMLQGVIYQDINGRITSVNHAAEKIFGYPANELIGKRSRDFLKKPICQDESPFDANEFPIAVSFRTSKKQENVVLGFFHPKLKTYCWTRINAIPLFKENEPRPYTAYATITDITEDYKKDSSIKKLAYEISEKNKELEQLLYIATHDLRTPLINIQGFTAEIVNSVEDIKKIIDKIELQPNIEKQLNKIFINYIPDSAKFINGSIAKMDLLLKGLLEISRLGRKPIILKEIDMNNLVNNVVTGFLFKIKEKKISLTIETLPNCMGDEEQISQTFYNLIGNAIKYLSLKREGKIKISGKVSNKSIIYCVEDNGIGIATNLQGKVLEIFYRIDNISTTGEGLGLSIVKKIMDRHNGNLWLESEVDVGSKFYISFSTHNIN